MKQALTLLNTLIIGFAAVVWTDTGESSDPVLADREMPADIASTCVLTQTGDIGVCHDSLLRPPLGSQDRPGRPVYRNE